MFSSQLCFFFFLSVLHHPAHTSFTSPTTQSFPPSHSHPKLHHHASFHILHTNFPIALLHDHVKRMPSLFGRGAALPSMRGQGKLLGTGSCGCGIRCQRALPPCELSSLVGPEVFRRWGTPLGLPWPWTWACKWSWPVVQTAAQPLGSAGAQAPDMCAARGCWPSLGARAFLTGRFRPHKVRPYRCCPSTPLSWTGPRDRSRKQCATCFRLGRVVFSKSVTAFCLYP